MDGADLLPGWNRPSDPLLFREQEVVASDLPSTDFQQVYGGRVRCDASERVWCLWGPFLPADHLAEAVFIIFSDERRFNWDLQVYSTNIFVPRPDYSEESHPSSYSCILSNPFRNDIPNEFSVNELL